MQALWFCDGNVVVSDTNDRAIPFMSPVDPSELLATSRSKSKPEVTELCQRRAWDATETFVRSEVW